MESSSTPGTSTFEIVQATLAHITLVAPLFDAYRQFYGHPPNLEAGEAFLKARLADGSSTIFLATSTDSTPPRGLGFTQLYPSFSSGSLRSIWILNDLFVAPEARRSGVGRALLERAREFAISTGAAKLTLQTAVTNTAAQALYESLGWRRDSEFYSYVLPV
jgi:GNAT superfamily N-acetyltransferase